jgi:hypothetical protein
MDIVAHNSLRGSQVFQRLATYKRDVANAFATCFQPIEGVRVKAD